MLRLAAEAQFHDGNGCCADSCCNVPYGDRGGAKIDGTVGKDIAVEIESRTSKQVRGAVLDLLYHRYPKKLLVLLPVHMHNPSLTAAQCTAILGRDLSSSNFRVVLARGSARDEHLEEDANRVRSALRELDVDL